MAVLSGPKKGIFGQFLGVKLKINFLSIFERILSINSKNYLFIGFHAKFQPQQASNFQVMAVLSGPKRGIYGRF
jgi:hypothetical protein